MMMATVQFDSEFGSAYKMEMEVFDSLTAVFAYVGYNSVTVRETALRGDCRYDFEHFFNCADIAFANFVNGADMCFGNYKHVYGRTWIDILERVNVFVFEHFCGRYIPVNNLAEKAIHFYSPNCVFTTPSIAANASGSLSGSLPPPDALSGLPPPPPPKPEIVIELEPDYDMDVLLRRLVAEHGSDLHISVGVPPVPMTNCWRRS